MIQRVDVRQKEGLVQQAEAIRQSSFDPGDLVKIERLIRLMEQGYGHFQAILEEEEVVGLLYFAPYEKVTYLLYLAIMEEKRSKGIGAWVLRDFVKQERNPVILDVESPMETEAEDIEERIRRKAFYLRNGFQETGHILKDDGGYYELLTTNGQAYDEEFMDAMEKFDFVKYHPQILTDIEKCDF